MLWYGVTLMRSAIGRARDLRRNQRGATVLEWALIAAAVVVAASIIGAVIFRIVEQKGSDLEDCANRPAGARC